jgi:hypothetical protein
VRLDPRRTGEAIAAASGDLARIWRAARLEARPDVFPGALDGLVEDFVANVGQALVLGRTPREAWDRTEGVVRIDRAAEARAEGELTAEWRLLGEVLAAACDTLDTDPAAADQVAQTVEEGRRGTEGLREGRGSRELVVVLLLSGFRPRGGERR